MSGVGGRAPHRELAVVPLRPVQMQVLPYSVSDRRVRTRFLGKCAHMEASGKLHTSILPLAKKYLLYLPGWSLGAALLAGPVFDLLSLVT